MKELLFRDLLVQLAALYRVFNQPIRLIRFSQSGVMCGHTLSIRSLTQSIRSFDRKYTICQSLRFLDFETIRSFAEDIRSFHSKYMIKKSQPLRKVIIRWRLHDRTLWSYSFIFCMKNQSFWVYFQIKDRLLFANDRILSVNDWFLAKIVYFSKIVYLSKIV